MGVAQQVDEPASLTLCYRANVCGCFDRERGQQQLRLHGRFQTRSWTQML
jgi:hypothetical protein